MAHKEKERISMGESKLIDEDSMELTEEEREALAVLNTSIESSLMSLLEMSLEGSEEAFEAFLRQLRLAETLSRIQLRALGKVYQERDEMRIKQFEFNKVKTAYLH
jgi:hypothetical protein